MATFAEIEITFDQEFDFNVQNNGLSIGFTNQSTQSSGVVLETIVQTRSQAFEFSAGTDSNTQAQLYKDAIDLDFVASGQWECTILVNVVTVKSTNPDIFINQLFTFAPNDLRVSALITNTPSSVPAVDGLMLARSNYYLSLGITTELFQNVQMFFRTGDTSASLASPNYEKKVFTPSLNWEYFDVLISRFALDFLNPRPVWRASTGILPSAVGSLVATTIRTQNNVQTSPQSRIVDLITTRGYSSYADGANYLDTTSNVLLTSKFNQVQQGDTIVVPVLADGSSYFFEDKDQNIIYGNTIVNSQIVENRVQYLFVDTTALTTPYIVLNTEYIFEIVKECKFTPVNVMFLNRLGVFEQLTFFKAKTESVTFTQEGQYKNNFVLGGLYDTSRHLYRSGNKNARTTVSLNSGYLNEQQNEALKDLLNSEYVYFNDAGTFTPVNVESKSLRVLTGLNDKLINYAIDFLQSFDAVQNV
jgi:hypothetical protein